MIESSLAKSKMDRPPSSGHPCPVRPLAEALAALLKRAAGLSRLPVRRTLAIPKSISRGPWHASNEEDSSRTRGSGTSPFPNLQATSNLQTKPRSTTGYQTRVLVPNGLNARLREQVYPLSATPHRLHAKRAPPMDLPEKPVRVLLEHMRARRVFRRIGSIFQHAVLSRNSGSRSRVGAEASLPTSEMPQCNRCG
jgi:hypothetical protein